MKFSQMMEIFQAGKSVANPEFWKQKTINANTIMVLLSGLVAILNMFDCGICNMHLTPEQLIGLATGITTVAGLFNIGSTMATSTKVGFKPKATATISEEVVEETIEEVEEEEEVKPTKKKLVSSSLSDDIEKLQ